MVDLPELCAACDVRRQFDFFKEAATAEMAQRFKHEPCAWSFGSLYEDVLSIMRLDRSLKGRGYPKGCDVLTARCLDILRREQFRPRRIESWEWKQRAKNRPHD